MTKLSSNLRKAAVLIRSLDADSAAALVAQLSPAEAASVREAIRALGPLDPDEQADLLAEFRRARPMAIESARDGVELSLSKPAGESGIYSVVERPPQGDVGKRFEFLEKAPTHVLVSYLSREQAQTVAVVLAHLAPAHAADVLAALPEKLQAATIERLSVLGDTDSESIAVLESELAEWAANRTSGRVQRGGRADPMSAILAAADAKTRSALLKRLKSHDIGPADRSCQSDSLQEKPFDRLVASNADSHSRAKRSIQTQDLDSTYRRPQPPAPSPQPLLRIDFDHLIHLDDFTLATVLREVDANALALALAGSDDDLVDRICAQMPKQIAKTFRRELRRMGPTRLSDVEAAQRLVAHHAALQLARRRMQPVAQAG